jgi:hypothetical protein
MRRTYRYALLIVLVAATLACGLITNPINDARGAVQTVQSVATVVPSLEALASAFPSLEVFASAFPTVESFFNPTGEPVDVWNDIPVMPEATAGSEPSGGQYSYVVPVSVADVEAFYRSRLEALGWSQMMAVPGTSEGSVMVFTKDSQFLTITVADMGDQTSVLMFMQ